MPLKLAHCEASFIPTHSGTRYCSRDCFFSPRSRVPKDIETGQQEIIDEMAGLGYSRCQRRTDRESDQATGDAHDALVDPRRLAAWLSPTGTQAADTASITYLANRELPYFALRVTNTNGGTRTHRSIRQRGKSPSRVRPDDKDRKLTPSVSLTLDPRRGV